MISPFGVEHGEINKLGQPQLHGRTYTGYLTNHKTNETKTQHPTEMAVRDTGKKTLFLRRKKYTFNAYPGKMPKKVGEGQHYFLSTPRGKVRPHGRDVRQQILEHVQSKGGAKSKKIHGFNVRRVD